MVLAFLVTSAMLQGPRRVVEMVKPMRLTGRS